jgi:hypothetical protein
MPFGDPRTKKWRQSMLAQLVPKNTFPTQLINLEPCSESKWQRQL